MQEGVWLQKCYKWPTTKVKCKHTYIDCATILQCHAIECECCTTIHIEEPDSSIGIDEHMLNTPALSIADSSVGMDSHILTYSWRTTTNLNLTTVVTAVEVGAEHQCDR